MGGFELAYSEILSGSVNVQPSQVEKLASTRQNIDSKDVYEIAQQCRKIYNEYKKQLMPETSIAAQSDTSKVASFADIMKRYAHKLKARMYQ